MGMLNFDARTVSPQISLEPLPEAWYKVVIVKSNIKPTNAGDGGKLELILQVIEGQYQGRICYWNLNLFNPNQQAVEIAYKTLSAISHVTGQFHVQDQNVPDNSVPMLHNIPFMAHIVLATGNQGSINNVKGVRDIQGNDPGKQGQGPAMAAPAQGAPMYTPPQGASAPANAGAPPAGSWAPNGGQAPNPAQPAAGQAPAAAWQAPAVWQPPQQGAPQAAPAQAAGAPQPAWAPQGQGGAPAQAPWNKT